MNELHSRMYNLLGQETILSLYCAYHLLYVHLSTFLL